MIRINFKESFLRDSSRCFHEKWVRCRDREGATKCRGILWAHPPVSFGNDKLAIRKPKAVRSRRLKGSEASWSALLFLVNNLDEQAGDVRLLSLKVQWPTAVRHTAVSRGSDMFPLEHEASKLGAMERRQIGSYARIYVKKNTIFVPDYDCLLIKMLAGGGPWQAVLLTLEPRFHQRRNGGLHNAGMALPFGHNIQRPESGFRASRFHGWGVSRRFHGELKCREAVEPMPNYSAYP